MNPDIELTAHVNALTERLDRLTKRVEEIKGQNQRLKDQTPTPLPIKELAQQTAAEIFKVAILDRREQSVDLIEAALLEARHHATKPLHQEMESVCQQLLITLATVQFPTPQESYGSHISWAASDAIRCIKEKQETIYVTQDQARIAMDQLRKVATQLRETLSFYAPVKGKTALAAYDKLFPKNKKSPHVPL